MTEVLIKVLMSGENRSFEDFIDSINKMAYTQPIKSKSKTSEVAVIRKGDFVEICQEWVGGGETGLTPEILK